METKNARVFWDADSDPRNPGWIVELQDTLAQHPLFAGADADDDDLIAEVESWGAGRYEIQIDRSGAPTLDQLFAALKPGTQELHDDLPTFGGDYPEPDRGGIWSWDKTRVIVGTCADDLRIVSRDELNTNQIGAIDGDAILEHDGSREDGWCVECGRHLDPVGNAGVFESLPYYATHPGTDAWDGSCPYCGAAASRVGVRAD